jgi:hypothetical protein
MARSFLHKDSDEERPNRYAGKITIVSIHRFVQQPLR